MPAPCSSGYLDCPGPCGAGLHGSLNETDGELRGTSKLFFRVPVGAELCGPAFTPDGKTLFLAIQHPAEEDAEGNAGSFENPPTRWPDFADGMPARPSVVVITKEDGGPIGA